LGVLSRDVAGAVRLRLDGVETRVVDDAGWDAQLALRFARCGARTELVERSHYGPLRVQRPFHPEPFGSCHVYVLHPPGGVVGGDSLTLQVDVEPGAHALLTTPAASKLYRTAGARASVQQTLRVQRDACLEWLPQETIAFSGAQAVLQTRVELEPGARFLGWEVLCLGRPASGERFEQGAVAQRVELFERSRLVYCERGRYGAGSPVLHAPWGLRGQPVVGTLVCAGRDLSGSLAPLRESLAWLPAPALAAISCMGELSVARYLGPSTEQARSCFERLWQVLRPLLYDQPACAPRIWAT
jgi:urease accessory protein